MRFLIDECLRPALADGPRVAGHDAVHLTGLDLAGLRVRNGESRIGRLHSPVQHLCDIRIQRGVEDGLDRQLPTRAGVVSIDRDAGPTLEIMSVTIELAAEAQTRLEGEAARRGITLGELVAELASRLPAEDPLEAFIGSASSGRSEPFDIHRERDELAKNFSEGV